MSPCRSHSWLFLALCSATPNNLLQYPILNDIDVTAESICRDLAARFPDLVSFPKTEIYECEQVRYWSSRQADEVPTCRLTPRNTLETSAIMSTLHSNELDFSIVSGGHGTADGASNLDGGITLDLSSLSAVSTSPDKSLVLIETGARWVDVYESLDQQNITVAGARAGSVAVGGFLLGGGISVLAARHGWSCDTVTGIEVILSNGTVIKSDEEQHRDLFQVMKGGGSNLGIPTRYTMRTFPLQKLEVAIIRYERDSIHELVDKLSTAVREELDSDSAFDLSISFDAASNTTVAFLMFIRIGEVEESPMLRNMLNISHGFASITTWSPRDLAQDLDLGNPAGYRQHKVTMTIRNDAETTFRIAREFECASKNPNLAEDAEYRPGMLIQPIYSAQLGNRFGNSLGLDHEDSPLLLLSFEVRWSNAALDKLYIDLLDNLLSRSQVIAKKRQTLHPFVYLNYAAAYQDPFATLHQGGKLEELKSIRDKYDQTHYLQKHLRQPFKMWDE